jgi:hypothetical protein
MVSGPVALRHREAVRSVGHGSWHLAVGLDVDFPIRGESSAQVVHVKLKPITEINEHLDFHDLFFS